MKPIKIPFAVDKENNPITLDFNMHSIGTMIVGRVGSGKTTVLKHIVEHVIHNYTSNEVELYIADVKGNDFNFLKESKEEQIKQLLLKSDEDAFVKFVNELNVLHESRLKLLMEHGWVNVEKIPKEQKMPLVFVIVDELSMAADGHNNDFKYKIERLLREGRATGLRFIFTSQSSDFAFQSLTQATNIIMQQRVLLNQVDEYEMNNFIKSAVHSTVEVSDGAKNSRYYAVALHLDENGNEVISEGTLLKYE